LILLLLLLLLLIVRLCLINGSVLQQLVVMRLAINSTSEFGAIGRTVVANIQLTRTRGTLETTDVPDFLAISINHLFNRKNRTAAQRTVTDVVVAAIIRV